MNHFGSVKGVYMRAKILFGFLFLFLLLLVAGCTQRPVQDSDTEWRCSVLNCVESVNLTGEQWAQQNCVITEQGNFCRLVLEDGQVQTVALENLNLSAITATQCIEYVCVEEAPFRTVNYVMNLT